MPQHRIVFIQPCCIGDVVLATAALKALRRAYPEAQITWAVGSWSRPAIETHDLIDSLIDTGDKALPVYSIKDFLRFVRQLRAGHYDLAISLVRSPLMSLAVWLSGIPHRAGIDSAGRGFGYNIRAPVRPDIPRHEAEIYLDVVRALGIDTTDCYVNVPVLPEHLARMQQRLDYANVRRSFFIINPAGGNNPGMMMDMKRWPPEHFAALADRLRDELNFEIVIVAGPKDQGVVDAVISRITSSPLSFVGILSFGEIAALAKLSQLYIGNDTGLTHFAAAAGAKTVMILGPSDPKRYAPFTPNAIALWKPSQVKSGGVASGSPQDWNWQRDGIRVDEVYEAILRFIKE
jgi:ADP-heptose:LPS heptosyltransferase